MVSLLTRGANLHCLNCLGARHIACFTIVHLICAKVQIVDNLSRISPSKMTLTCDVIFQVVFLILNQCACFLQVFHTCVHKFRGRLLYKLDALKLTHFQAYHVCSSLIARKMESPELSIILQISTTYCKW